MQPCMLPGSMRRRLAHLGGPSLLLEADEVLADVLGGELPEAAAQLHVHARLQGAQQALDHLLQRRQERCRLREARRGGRSTVSAANVHV